MNQCLGLAQHLGVTPIIKRIQLRSPWRQLAPHILRGASRAALAATSDPLDPPWPDLVIASGRRTIPAALYLRKASRKGGAKGCLTVQIQAPPLGARGFDLIVAPKHDRLRGPQVINTLGALNGVTPEGLAQARRIWSPRFAHLPRPLVAVLIGGNSRSHQLPPQAAAALGIRLAAMSKTSGAGLLVTTSRRTGTESAAILRETLQDCPAWFWDGQGENPYMGFLAVADTVIVTADSTSMISEACTAGKPVLVAEIPGGSSKFRRFHENLQASGFTRPFQGKYETWSRHALNETAAVAAHLRGLLARHINPRETP